MSTYTRVSDNLLRATESVDQRIHRLAHEARTAGLQILEDPLSNQAFCTSQREPDRLHRVSHIHCTCRGFFYTGDCRHHALFLWSRNALPALPGTECRIVPFRRRISDVTPQTAA